jgi:hypothetical protein
MSSKLVRHYRDSQFIPFRHIAGLQQHLDWLALLIQGCDAKRDTERVNWLRGQRIATKTEIDWRQHEREKLTRDESDGE